MVYGIEKFKDYFGAHLDRYVIIGGTACNMIYAQYGAQERATQDIDMIIVAEAFDREFYELFCRFVQEGGYEHRGKVAGYQLYRFEKPASEGFPPKIELLSKRSDCLEGIELALGRFHTVDANGSLSAIMLDDDYYALLEEDGIEIIDGLPVLAHKFLPVFKIHAWANLSADKKAGREVHSDEINKHRRDVLRLCALFDPGTRIELPQTVAAEVEAFLGARPWDDNMMRNLRLPMTADEMADHIRAIYLV